MTIRIHQLSSLVANQIAAGEVIERPASVIKELLENSFDAMATSIHIDIDYGGINLIRISDNGCGIIADDLRLALAAHATSKIQQLDDLYAINSMGFRGEALASIASVARLSLSSRPADQPHAMKIESNNGEVTISPCAHNIGTTIEVKDLFFNAPVRKKFLKSEQQEFRAIEQVVRRFALSAPHIGLTVKHNNKLYLTLKPVDCEKSKLTRISKLLGKSFIEQALYLDTECAGIRIHGWISGLNYQRSQNDKQWLYINRRMVKDKLLNHAIKQAYEGFLYPGRFPACLLYITLPSEQVDVNVHPTKHEVRFQQPRLIHDLMVTEIIQSLGQEQAAPIMPIAPHGQDKYYVNEAPKSIFNPIDKNAYSSEQRWLSLNPHFALISLHGQRFMVDIARLQQDMAEQALSSAVFPLASRSLLVPVRQVIDRSSHALLEQHQESLNQLGIDFAFLSEDVLVVRSVPVDLPYLDISLFFDALLQKRQNSLSDLLVLLCASLAVDANNLTVDERGAIQQYIQHEIIDKGIEKRWCVSLTITNCRLLFDA
ncbi:MAG: DNA mismatch repair endonuclease MutL [Legionella sp.]